MVLFQQMVALMLIMVLLFTVIGADADIHKFVLPDGTTAFTNVPSERGGKIVYKESKRNSTSKAADIKSGGNAASSSFNSIANEKALKYNLDPQLVKAVIKAESNWNPNAVSPKGARGLMQLMPSTAYELGVYNSFDPEENIDGGARYLRYLLGKFNGDLNLALAAYNAGPGRVEKTQSVPAIPETVQYVKRVMSLYSGLPSLSYAGGFSAGNKTVTRIKKLQLEDGTLLFTNSQIIY